MSRYIERHKLTSTINFLRCKKKSFLFLLQSRDGLLVEITEKHHVRIAWTRDSGGSRLWL